MNVTGFQAGDLLLPRQVDLTKWSVVACDQYTSQPEYWEAVDQLVGSAPSSLRLILPEALLGSPDGDRRIAAINEAMHRYQEQGIFAPYPHRYLYLERTQRDGAIRRGLMGVVDLEQYDYRPGSRSLVRATEGTVLERIPPRVKVRKDAPLELPHILLLIDDREKTILEPLAARKGELESVYDFPLMMDSGHLRGWLVDDEGAASLEAALARLADPAAFDAKYQVQGQGVLLFAVGDGNHSLATAKTCWEELKPSLSPAQRETHPARWALVEVVNLHDPALVFEPIHRVLFQVDPQDLLESLSRVHRVGDGEGPGQRLRWVSAQGEGVLRIEDPDSNLPVGTLQRFLDRYLEEKGGRVDYVHGEDVARRLGSQPHSMAFLLPAMAKEDLFPTVILDGALPRKTFSMGHAWDKRFYLEARAIR